MRMGVWEIMSIDRSLTEIRKKLQQTAGFGGESLEALNEKPQKTIDPQLDRSLELKSAESEQLDSEHLKSTSPNPSIAECRDCPEGMEW
jgi:hypothetical protein